jgi:uncharacterized membrane protein YcjF (UPF0283 family)
MQNQPDQKEKWSRAKIATKFLAILGSLAAAIVLGVQDWFRSRFLKHASHETLETAVWLLVLLVIALVLLSGFLAWPHIVRFLNGKIDARAYRQAAEFEHRPGKRLREAFRRRHRL